MAKLTKHAEYLTQLHSLVTKQAAEAQKNISGEPGKDTNPTSMSADHENVDKNAVKPENNPQGYHQKPSEDSAEPLTGGKTAEAFGQEILDLLRNKQAEAQTGITGKPGADTKPTSMDKKHDNFDKNSVKPEDNTPQEYKQEKSKDKAEPVTSTKKAEDELRDMAAKVASYELGRQFCAALLKTASDYSEPSQAELMKEAGRRDFDLLINEASSNLKTSSQQVDETSVKQAEDAGAAYFDEILKQAALEEAIAENEQLRAKVAEDQRVFESLFQKEASAQQAEANAQYQAQLATKVAEIVLEKLKSTPAA